MNKLLALVAVAVAPLFLAGDDFLLFYLDPGAEMSRQRAEDPISYDEASAKLSADSYFMRHPGLLHGASYSYTKTTFVTTNVAPSGDITIGWILDVDVVGPLHPDNQFAIGFAAGDPHPVAVGKMCRASTSGNNVTRETVEKTVFDSSIRAVVDDSVIHGYEPRYTNLYSRTSDPRWRNACIGASSNPNTPWTIDGPLVTE